MNAIATAAFPAHLAATVDGLSALLAPDAEDDCGEPLSVSCAGETLLIPYRIYSPAPSDSELRALDETERTIVACWFTRHHDGQVRERFLRSLTAFDNAWVIAYVVAVSGEYVIEILRCIWERRELFDRPMLGRWLRDNEPFYARTRSRVVSYWNCYYRSSYPHFADYLGGQLLAFFDDAGKG